MAACAHRITSTGAYPIRTQTWRLTRCRLDAKHLKEATTGSQWWNSNHYRSETLQTYERCIGSGARNWNYAITKGPPRAWRKRSHGSLRCTKLTFSRPRPMKRWDKTRAASALSRY